MEILRRILKRPSRERRTLHDLVRANDVCAVVRVLDSGADVDKQDERMWTALHVAAFLGRTVIAVVLMDSGADLVAREADAWTPLHFCCLNKTNEIATMSKKRGVDLWAKKEKDWTPLHAGTRRGTTEIAKMLVERGVDVEARTASGWTPLHVCSQCRSTEIATLLMERGADLGAKTNCGWTPFHVCSQYGSTEIATMLVERDADLDTKEEHGWTPLHVCAHHGTTEIATMIIGRTFFVNAVTNYNVTPLHVAAGHGHVDILEELLKHGAQMSFQNVDGDTALHIAINNDQQEAVFALLAKANEDLVNLADKKGRTALHLAVNKKLEFIAQAIVDIGARVDVKDGDGKTPIDYASPERGCSFTMLAVQRERPTSSCNVLKGDPGTRIRGAIVHDPEVSIEVDALESVVAETKLDENSPLISTEKERLKMAKGYNAISRRCQASCSYDVDINPTELSLAKLNQGESDDFSSSSSESGEWIPDVPFGSRGRLLKATGALKPGQIFADDYTIAKGNLAGKPHVRLSKQRYGKKHYVALKFYSSEEAFQNTIDVHPEFSHSEHVCRLLQPLKTSKTGHPPCVVFEKGSHTLHQWLLHDRSLLDKRWCLHQILVGLRDVHAEGIVHTDVKPSNIMFFSDSVTWKLIDLDGAQRAGKSRATYFTIAYAAPEVLREWQDRGKLPVAQTSSDLWSFGVLAYEVLTGVRMFDNDSSADEIYEFVLDGKIEERLGLITDEWHHNAISNFLKFDPKERWSANDALNYSTFESYTRNTTTQI